MEILTALIDAEAQKVFNFIHRGNPFLEEEPLRRFACYAAAEGSNPVTNFSETRFIHRIEPATYMAPVLPKYLPPRPKASKDGASSVSVIRGPRRKYKVAYLLMAHGSPNVLENIKTVVDELDDGMGIIMIHVDLAYPELYRAVENWINTRQSPVAKARIAAQKKPRKDKGGPSNSTKVADSGKDTIGNDSMNSSTSPQKDKDQNNEGPTILNERSKRAVYSSETPLYENNVFLAEKRYGGIWGHISLVWMQLSGFWELLDIADWDYVINLSAFDFPLRKTPEIHQFLKSKSANGEVFIELWPENCKSIQSSVFYCMVHLKTFLIFFPKKTS
jgi:hypothetical protein